MLKRNSDTPFFIFAFVWVFVIVLNLAWVGTLIWAVIYALTHMGEWIG